MICLQYRTQIINTIRSKNHSNGLRFINYLGILSILIICGLNVASFFIQYEDQNNQKLNFQNIYWCFQLKRFISLTFGNSGLMKGLFFQLYMFKSQLEFKEFFGYITGVNQYLISSYQNMTLEMMQGDLTNIHVFNQVNNYQINLTFPSYTNDTDTVNITSTLTYKMIMFQGYQYYMMNLIDPLGKNELAAGLNYNSMFIALDYIYDDNKANFFSKIEYSKYIITIQLVIILIIVGMFIFLIIPIYMYCMKKKEDILKLFATIPADKIIFMMATVSKYLDLQEHMDIINTRTKFAAQTSNNHLDNYLKKNSNAKLTQKQIQQLSSNQIILKKPLDNIKKKNISTTNNIDKLNLKLFFGLTIFLALIVFYPICNYFITMTQISNFTDILQFLNSFDYFIDNLTSMMSIKFGFTFAFNYPLYPPDALQAYLVVAQYYTSQNQNLSNQMMTAFNTFETYGGYNSNPYNNFLLPFFKENVCSVVFQSNQNYLGDVTFTYDECLSTGSGVFQKGFFLVINKLENIFQQFFEAAYTQNLAIFNSMLFGLQQSLNISEEYKFLQNILFSAKIIHQFFQDTYLNYHNLIFYLQVFLVSLQLVTIALVMVVAWRKFYILLGRAYYRSKQLLDLMDINTVIDNPYIVSYFKKNV